MDVGMTVWMKSQLKCVYKAAGEESGGPRWKHSSDTFSDAKMKAMGR